jgi:uncharacterized protein (TIGR02594 family)
MHFQVRLDVEGDMAPLFDQPSKDAELVVNIAPGRDLESAAPPGGPSDLPPGWVFISAADFVGDPRPKKGWMRLSDLVATAGPTPPAFDVGRFVRSCVRTEFALNAGDIPDSFPVTADYLIAWALIESGIKNLPADPAGGHAGGPFAFSDAQWQAYLAPAAGEATIAGRDYRGWAELHPYVAGFIAQIQMDAYSEKRSVADAKDGPFVPSYLDVLHCQLFGLEPAVALDRAQEAGGTQPAADVLTAAIPDAADRARVMARRASLLAPGGSVGALFAKTEKLLDETFAKADELIREHFPEVIPEKAILSGDAPWFGIAEGERVAWETGRLAENQGPGKTKVLDYFKATDSGIDKVAPWCGAFVAFCLTRAGAAPESTIVKGSARAANWKDWGNTELKLGLAGDGVPQGAVVVTKALAPGASGHVGFFHGATPTHVRILGGNQSNRVKVMDVARSKIVAIRWYFGGDLGQGIVPTPPGGGVSAPSDPTAATAAHVLTLARTLYGEARGQGQTGIEAVANVVMNRLKTGRWGKDVGRVCLWPKQFSCWNHNDANFLKIRSKTDDGDKQFRICLDVARAAVDGTLTQHVPDVLHYFADYIPPPGWVRKSPKARLVKKIGNHLFYAGIR